MHIVLLILKIIGIVLLAILGIILFALFLLLFVPVRYSIDGEIDEERNVKISGNIRWLFSIISYRFRYEDLEYTAKLRIFGLQRKEKNGIRDDAENNLAKEENDFDEEIAAAKQDNVEENNIERTAEEAKKREGRQTEKEQAVKDQTEKEQKEKKTEENKEKRAAELNHGKHEKSRQIRNVFSKIKDIKAIISDETNQRIVKYIFGELIYLLKHFRFRKLYTNIEFSLADPALTGQALGGLCLIPALYHYDVHIYPDFDSAELYVKGTFSLAGRVRLVHLIVTLGRLWSYEEIRVIVKKWLKGR